MDVDFSFCNINIYNIKDNPLYCKERDIESDEKICRICLEGEGNLINVCNCKGTMAFVHKECIEMWINTTNIVENQKKCQICKSEFNFNLIEKKTEEVFVLKKYLIMLIILFTAFVITYIYLN